jgi:hypothetical protein
MVIGKILVEKTVRTMAHDLIKQVSYLNVIGEDLVD